MLENIIISTLIGIVWYQVMSHWAFSILLHRYYCHKQFPVPVWFEVVGLAMMMVAVVRSPIGWIAAHRLHHEFSDGPGDPHSARQVGFWRVLTTTWDIPDIPYKHAKDLYRNPRLAFCHKHWVKLWIISWIVSYLISPYFFIAFALVPAILAKIGFGLLNVYGHGEVGGSNVWWLNLWTSGEGYHLEHHKNWKRVRLSKWDTSGWIAEKLFDPTTGLLTKGKNH